MHAVGYQLDEDIAVPPARPRRAFLSLSLDPRSFLALPSSPSRLVPFSSHSCFSLRASSRNHAGQVGEGRSLAPPSSCVGFFLRLIIFYTLRIRLIILVVISRNPLRIRALKYQEEALPCPSPLPSPTPYSALPPPPSPLLMVADTAAGAADSQCPSQRPVRDWRESYPSASGVAT